MTLEEAGALLSENRYWLTGALIDAKFHWHQQYDKAGNESSPFDRVLDAIPRQTDAIVDTKGYYRQASRRSSGFVPHKPVYHWLGREGDELKPEDSGRG